jgi:energy-converting hydrogenase Eha subunit F
MYFLFISNINIQFWRYLLSMIKSVLVSFAVIIVMVVGLTIIPVYAQQQQPPTIAPETQMSPQPRYPVPHGQQPAFDQASNFTFGPVASIQNNETGQPAWLVVGYWRGNLLSFNQTGTASDSPNNQANVSSIEGAFFSANLRMIMLNGSAPHTHIITNFRLSNVSFNENGTTTYTGSSTVSMPDGPIVDVPTIIKLSGELISIFPDPSSAEGHFGDTPIYAAISMGHGKDYAGRGPGPSGDPSLQSQQHQDQQQ